MYFKGHINRCEYPRKFKWFRSTQTLHLVPTLFHQDHSSSPLALAKKLSSYGIDYEISFPTPFVESMNLQLLICSTFISVLTLWNRKGNVGLPRKDSLYLNIEKHCTSIKRRIRHRGKRSLKKAEALKLKAGQVLSRKCLQLIA